ncbi:MAG: KpsF/GutQ family sugar-phosphate isomerase [Alphaproteobacteria bacterium]|nr:MAG: KpsF/GutQ family sugar-phosphate isomerase [Alphaproteobacteria bacterium]
MSGSVLERAQTVIQTEIAGLAELQKTLNQNFAATISLLMKTKGRVIVTGIGKSGHVARKLAATFASTGTPAQYVHPGEASHGDLGMITSDDAVLAISNSGEAPELGDIIAYAKRFAIPVIAITKNLQSSLGSAADVVLQLPDAAEACPMGLAPTTSTTMSLALGDALAVCLLEQKGFSPEQFREIHPGGKLGQRLMRVEKLMHTGAELPLVKPEDLMSSVLITISSKKFGCAGVIDKRGKLLGVITDGDMRRHMSDNFLTLSATEVMTPNPRTISSKALAAEALGIMNQKSITTLFVIDDDELQGIIHIHDCLRAGVM